MRLCDNARMRAPTVTPIDDQRLPQKDEEN